MLANTFQKITEIDYIKRFFKDGMTIMYGGFGGIGTPPGLVDAIIESKIKELTLIGNDTGFPDIGIGKIVTSKQVKRLIVSHIGSNPNAGKFMTNGELEIEFSPQGTLAERIRAGGMGLGGILTDVGADVEVVRRNKQTCEVDGKTFLIETALTADVSIVHAEKADPYGNLIFSKSARNTNPLVAMAGKITIAEAEEIVPLGELDPEGIITPGVFVDYIIPSKGVNWKWVWEQK
ncbi:CoA transferase subunit A [Peribacillus saganii]|uniref:CoA transferase subunit A n=1 Tax=Peribacillus saganii TaxID=2303992 RepID=A0A372LJ54_9BACI|nr:CoA transferase subunit A [Peribacillus saganii]RFU66449.1 CoA transferase subunit A [Peribacillus saganii]